MTDFNAGLGQIKQVGQFIGQGVQTGFQKISSWVGRKVNNSPHFPSMNFIKGLFEKTSAPLATTHPETPRQSINLSRTPPPEKEIPTHITDIVEHNSLNSDYSSHNSSYGSHNTDSSSHNSISDDNNQAETLADSPHTYEKEEIPFYYRNDKTFKHESQTTYALAPFNSKNLDDHNCGTLSSTKAYEILTSIEKDDDRPIGLLRWSPSQKTYYLSLKTDGIVHEKLLGKSPTLQQIEDIAPNIQLLKGLARFDVMQTLINPMMPRARNFH